MRCKTAGSAGSKWRPSAQEHFAEETHTGLSLAPKSHYLTWVGTEHRGETVKKKKRREKQSPELCTHVLGRLQFLNLSVKNCRVVFKMPHNLRPWEHPQWRVCLLQMDETWCVWQADQQSMVPACQAPVKRGVLLSLPHLSPPWTTTDQLLKHGSFSCFFFTISITFDPCVSLFVNPELLFFYTFMAAWLQTGGCILNTVLQAPSAARCVLITQSVL